MSVSGRSESRSLFQVPLRANPLLILSVILAQGVHILTMFTPGLNDALEIAPIAPRPGLPFWPSPPACWGLTSWPSGCIDARRPIKIKI